ncbi:hypothetical protein CsatA_001316 [Cannabis sativa]
MDKSWMLERRETPQFLDGFNKFLEFALKNSSNHERIPCPCVDCCNGTKGNITMIKDHVICRGFNRSYTTWYWHGERSTSDPYPLGKRGVDDFEFNDVDDFPMELLDEAQEEFLDDPEKLDNLVSDAEKPLFDGCKKLRLPTLVKFYNIKAENGVSDKGFSQFLAAFKEILPVDNCFPVSTYEVKKTLNAIGLKYEKIHACPNDCILYRNEYADMDSCPTCGLPRHKTNKSEEKRKLIPQKVMWYLPLIPRLKRLYRSSEHSANLIWHDTKRVRDGKLRHPADSQAWKKVDYLNPEFKLEPRHLRLGLSADGVNPHRSLSSRHSLWPVFLVMYNLPPWLVMKRKFNMLSLMISGPNQPGHNIDVYLAPLIDDLKDLYENGVETYDGLKKEIFKLKAVLLWTVSDFPAYSNLSGLSTKGYQSCPICCTNTRARRLTNGHKMCYMGHRRYLPRDHPDRRKKKAYDGTEERDSAPLPMSGEQILEQVEHVDFKYGKTQKRKKTNSCFQRKSIFFRLPYWKDLMVRHCLDVMHIEKNVCDSIIGTLLDIPGKTKDGLSSRLDLVEMGIRQSLAPEQKGKRLYLPPACYTLSKKEKEIVCKSLSNMKVPDGYSSNIKNLVNTDELKLMDMKSHDCHALMQHLLPIAIRSVLPKKVRECLTHVCIFFNQLCGKELEMSKLDALHEDIVKTLCNLERYFPPSFFDIMVHLMVHLVREAKLCGPVWARWMYPFERNMKVLKSYVRNHYRPEASMVECYISEEAVEFCSEYIAGVDTIGITKPRNSSDEFDKGLRGKGEMVTVSKAELDQAQLVLMHNNAEVQPYITEHMELLQSMIPRGHKNKQKWVIDEHRKTFIRWLKNTILAKLRQPNHGVSDVLNRIALGPTFDVWKHQAYIVNGKRFHTKSRDDARMVQNSGVCIVAESLHFATSKDNNPVSGTMTYYGVVNEIWELDYILFRIALFKCEWVDVNVGIRTDELGFTLVDLNKKGSKDDPFIMATQAVEVFYIPDPANSKWSVVLSTPERKFAENEDDDENDDLMHECFIVGQRVHEQVDDVEHDDVLDDIEFIRNDIEEGIWVDCDSIQKKRKKKRKCV